MNSNQIMPLSKDETNNINTNKKIQAMLMADGITPSSLMVNALSNDPRRNRTMTRDHIIRGDKRGFVHKIQFLLSSIFSISTLFCPLSIKNTNNGSSRRSSHDNTHIDDGRRHGSGGMNMLSDAEYFEYLIHPSGKFRKQWDSLMILSLAYIGLFVPFCTAFDVFPISYWCFAEIMNEIVLVIDLFINLFTAQEIKGVLIMSLTNTWHHYLRTWFAIDFIAVFPYFLLYGRIRMVAYRLLRLLQLSKLFGILKYQKYFEQFEDEFNVHTGFRRILNILFSILFFTHIVGCIWHLIPLLEAKEEAICTYYYVHGLNEDSWILYRGIEERNSVFRYLTAIYFCFSTLATVGFGDISAHSPGELIFAIFVTIVGVTWYAFVASSIQSVLANFDVSSKEIKEKKAALDIFCHEALIPLPLRKRLREYLELNTQNIMKKHAIVTDKVLADTSPELRAEVMLYINRRIIKSIPFLLGKSTKLISSVVSLFTETFSHSNDSIFIEGDKALYVYFLIKGDVILIRQNVKRSIAKKGAILGLAGIILSDVNYCTAKSKTLCEMQRLSRENIIKLEIDFPDFALDLKRLAVQQAIDLSGKQINPDDPILKALQQLKGLSLGEYQKIKDTEKMAYENAKGNKAFEEASDTSSAQNTATDLASRKMSRRMTAELTQKVEDLTSAFVTETNNWAAPGINTQGTFSPRKSSNLIPLDSGNLQESPGKESFDNLMFKLSLIETTMNNRMRTLQSTLELIQKNLIKTNESLEVDSDKQEKTEVEQPTGTNTEKTEKEMRC